MKPPPNLNVVTSEGLSRIEVFLGAADCFPGGGGEKEQEDIEEESELGDYLDSLDDLSFAIGSFDVDNFFHRLRTNEEFSRLFGLRPVPAAAVGLDGTTLDGTLLLAETPAVPCWNRLPMGCSWSLFFAQMVTESKMESVEQLRHAVCGSDGGRGIGRRRFEAGTVRLKMDPTSQVGPVPIAGAWAQAYVAWAQAGLSQSLCCTPTSSGVQR